MKTVIYAGNQKNYIDNDTTYNDTITPRSFVRTLQPGKIKSVLNDFPVILVLKEMREII